MDYGAVVKLFVNSSQGVLNKNDTFNLIKILQKR
jgi:hypothetical protein